MALREIWLGSQGPILVDDELDPEFLYPTQVAVTRDVATAFICSVAYSFFKIDLPIVSCSYDETNKKITELLYVGGYKVVLYYTGDLVTSADYLDADGSTLLYTKTFTYDGNNNLVSVNWS